MAAKQTSLNVLSTIDLLESLKNIGSNTVSYEANGLLSRLREIATECDSLSDHNLKVENRCQEIMVAELTQAIIKWGSPIEQRVVLSFMSNDRSLVEA